MNTTVVISNPMKPWLDSIILHCWVDSSSLMLSIPENIARQLQLEILEKREVILEDRSKVKVAYVGPVKLSFNNCSCFSCAFVFGDKPTLGAVRLDEIDFIVQNRTRPNMTGAMSRHTIYH